MACPACSLFHEVLKGAARPLSLQRSFRLFLTTQCLAISLLTGCLQPGAVPQVEQPSQTPQGPESSGKLRFIDHTDASGVNFTYRSGTQSSYAPILQDMGGGCGLLDFDLDGCLDVFFPGGGYINKAGPQPYSHGLFQNVEAGTFRDVSKSSAVMEGRFYSQGVASADYDADGFPDLLVTGYGGLQLFRNQGDGTFAEQTAAAGLTDRLWSTSAAWGDVNGDGELDLYVCHYLDWSPANDPVCEGPTRQQPESCPPSRFKGLPDILYLSQTDGTFKDISNASGLRDDGKGLGVVMADLDGDTDVDIYVTNDGVGNFLYRNEGIDAAGVPHLMEVGTESGAALSDSGMADGSMGVAILDLNEDREPDLWVSNFEFETPGLYQNDGAADFKHIARNAGLASRTCSFVGFGTVAADFDGDRDSDVLVTNGHVSRYPASGSVLQPCQLFENLGSTHFRDVAELAGDCLTKRQLGRGLAAGDIDGDGDPDVILTPKDEPARLLLNAQDNVSKWLRIQLVGRTSPRDGRGARVEFSHAGTRTVFWSYGGESYLSSSSAWILFPLSNPPAELQIKVTWPRGQLQSLTLNKNQEWAIDCGEFLCTKITLAIVEPRINN